MPSCRYSVPASVVTAVLREAAREGLALRLYPRAIVNAFGDIRATAHRALRGIITDLDFEFGEGTLTLDEPSEQYFETAWLCISTNSSSYTALVSAFATTPGEVTFELPAQLEVDVPDLNESGFDETILMDEAPRSFAALNMGDGIYRLRSFSEVPFDFPARRAAAPDVLYQVGVVGHPAEGYVDVELFSSRGHWSQPPPSVAERSQSDSGSGIRALPLRRVSQPSSAQGR